MSFIERKDPKIFLIRIKVKPNSKKQSILIDDQFLIVHLQSKAIKNKANKELISLLKKKLAIPSFQVKILSGAKSSNKLIEIIFDRAISEEDIIKKLLN